MFFIQQDQFSSKIRKNEYQIYTTYLGAHVTHSYKESGATVAHDASLEAIFREVTSLPAPENRDHF